MEVRVCKNCRRLFKYIYGPELCPECSKLVKTEINNHHMPKGIKPFVKDEEEKFQQVKDYIMTHPTASVAQISEENGITPIKLFDWIREERLEFSDDSEYAWFTCQSCGTKIKSGRLCYRCKMAR